MKKTAITVLVLIVFAFSAVTFSACNKDNVNLPDNLAYNKVAMAQEGMDGALKNSDSLSAYNNFSAKLINNLYENGSNTLVSPLSIYLALGMTSNAATGSTLDGFASALGLDRDELNAFCGYLYAYFMETDMFKSVNIANSIWLNSDLSSIITPKDSFLNVNAAYYGADVYKTPFDTEADDKINKWVSDKTDGMIKKLIDEIPQNSDVLYVAYLINTLFLDSKWAQSSYYDFQRSFTNADGNTAERAFLSANVKGCYTYTENAVALTSRLQNNLCFVGILPNGDLDDYMANLTGDELTKILTNTDCTKDVYGYFPTFEYDYSANLNDTLKGFGMTDAFDRNAADLSEGFSFDRSSVNLFISNVLHKTRIEVTKYGVRAAAATSVEIDGTTSAQPRERITIDLNRPFAYVLMDTTYNLPLFVGTYNG